MEQRREDDVEDYWLIQFQRLMDRKPQSLIDKVDIMLFFILREFAYIYSLRKSGYYDAVLYPEGHSIHLFIEKVRLL